MFVSKYTIFLEKEFLLREDSGSKGELGGVQSAQIDVGQLTYCEDVIHVDEAAVDPFETQSHRSASRISTIPKNMDFSLVNSGMYYSQRAMSLLPTLNL